MVPLGEPAIGVLAKCAPDNDGKTSQIVLEHVVVSPGPNGLECALPVDSAREKNEWDRGRARVCKRKGLETGKRGEREIRKDEIGQLGGVAREKNASIGDC